MSGLIALAFIGAGLLLAWFFTLLFPKKLRVYVWLVTLSCTAAYPFVHKLYPSYRQFQALCESPDRFVVHQVVPVRSAYVGHTPFHALTYGLKHGFASVEIKQGKLGYFRLATNEKWDTPECRSACAAANTHTWEKTCLPSCITMTSIAAAEFETKYDFRTRDLIDETLRETSTEVTAPNGSLLVTSKAYTYFPYGTTWAAALGGGSGTPPSRKCDNDSRLWQLPYVSPKGNK